ncbi:MAG: hypothetical protein ACOYEG_13955 [Petrimonas sp.]
MKHHNTSMIMSMFTEIVVAHVVSQTKQIRVRTGGFSCPTTAHSTLYNVCHAGSATSW